MSRPRVPAWVVYRIAERIFATILERDEASGPGSYAAASDELHTLWQVVEDLGITTQVEDAVDDYAQANDEGDPQS